MKYQVIHLMFNTIQKTKIYNNDNTVNNPYQLHNLVIDFYNSDIDNKFICLVPCNKELQNINKCYNQGLLSIDDYFTNLKKLEHKTFYNCEYMYF